MKKTAFAAAALLAVVALAGCKKKEETPGEKLDHATKNVQDAAKDMKK